ncbi:hypothetical protein [Rhizobium sp. SSA_523]|nr:hypothetical protein [Rhizobium sp. SSA_523]MCO5734102.1 hypothetical protein [Rhizobium sp. SSA_523]WKC24740.1 hypothetical protein QTJ18_11985 [Rhizobium sp. SSA_523]
MTYHSQQLEIEFRELLAERIMIYNRALAYLLSATIVYGLGFYAAFQI